ncbi:porin family protein [uncultured Rikenella sp.]|uniref:porin family protein n=1 Tax=uncultured Rikenella sp. TaxID=368003 RepID=UPI0026143FC6|nr:porin family protein [uncultured Rikenella sp.]
MKRKLSMISAALSVFTLLPAAAQETETADTAVVAVEKLVVRQVGAAPADERSGNNDLTTHSREEDVSYSSSSRQPKRWKWRGGHWAGVGIYYNGLVRNLGTLSLPDGADYLRQTPKSIGVNVNFADFTLVSNRHFGLITGLGLEMNNFRFDENISLTRDGSGRIGPDYSYDAAGIDLKKSKLTTVYLNIPLLVEFQFGRSKAGRPCPGFVNFGVIGGMRLQGHTKVKYRDTNGDMQTRKQHSGLNLRNFHYGVEFNVGYRYIALSARYYPHNIFVADKGPNVQQVNIGLSLVF